MSESSVVEVSAGVSAGVIGVVAGTSGDSALSEASDDTLHNTGVSAVGVDIVSSPVLPLLVLIPLAGASVVSGSKWPGILSVRLSDSERRGVEAVSAERQETMVPEPVWFVEVVSLRSLRLALAGGLLTSLVPLTGRARRGIAASELSSPRSSVP